MKRFLLKLGLFLLPLLVCSGLVEMKLQSMPNTYSKKRADLESQLNDIQVLVLGPSHALHGIDPARFTKRTFNLANASQDIYYDRELTLRYIDRMPALKLVILPISYNSLYTRLADSRESFRCFFYSKFWGIDGPGMTKLDLRRYSDIALYTPQTTLEFLSKGFKKDLTEGLTSGGYLPYDTTGCMKNISYELGAKRVELYRRMMREQHYGENVDALTQLVTTLRQRNIQVCFITTPVFKTFARYCEPEVYKTNLSVLRDLCSQHGCGYKSYLNDSRFTIRDFYDNDHLNFIGAARFSAILDSDVVARVNFN